MSNSFKTNNVKYQRKALGDITNASRPIQAGKASAYSLTELIHVPPQSKEHTSHVTDWTDFDKLNESDPEACGVYAPAIFEHLAEAEKLRQPNPYYLDVIQPDINVKMRAILVNWLVEVSEEYRLQTDTLFQTVDYLDRYLSVVPVQRSQLQLVGVSCMWIAAKYEEIFPPKVGDFCFITDNTYKKEEIIKMEEDILEKLDWQLTVPTAKTFLRRLLQVCEPDEFLHFLSNYLTELTLLDHQMLTFLPSELAASAVLLAQVILQRPIWSGNLRHYSRYEPRQLMPCVQVLASLHNYIYFDPKRELPATAEKYAQARFREVAKFQPVAPVPDYVFA